MKQGVCEICTHKFMDGQHMNLALNRGDGGNLLICDTCRDKAVESGVSYHIKN